MIGVCADGLGWPTTTPIFFFFFILTLFPHDLKYAVEVTACKHAARHTFQRLNGNNLCSKLINKIAFVYYAKFTCMVMYNVIEQFMAMHKAVHFSVLPCPIRSDIWRFLELMCRDGVIFALSEPFTTTMCGIVS